MKLSNFQILTCQVAFFFFFFILSFLLFSKKKKSLAYFFPLDVFVVGFIVLYLLACTLYGMSHVGVRVLCIRTHTLRPRRTSTRGILFMVVNVVFTIIASTKTQACAHGLTPWHMSGAISNA